MKTSNKILLSGFLVVILAAITLMVIFRLNLNKARKAYEQLQDTQIRELESFRSINGKGNLTIKWSQGNTQKIKIEGHKDDIEKISTTVKEDTLYVTLRSPLKQKTRTRIHITSDSINEIILTDTCELDMDTKAVFDKLAIDLSSHSELELHGEANSARIFCSSKSHLDAEGLIIRNCYIETESEATAEIKASKKLNILAKSNSKVYYSGKPENININTETGGGVEED